MTTAMPTSSAPALKEWGTVAHALAQGWQKLLLRKGGIREKRFEVGAARFWLFPTVAHSHAENVRPEFADLLDLGAADVSEGSVVVRVELEVVEAVVVRRTDDVGSLAEFHIWTEDSVRRTRVDFRPRHELTALVVRTRVRDVPATVPRTPEQVGCFSWLDVAVPDAPSRPVGAADDLAAVAAEVRRRVG